jgi:hypothetical protein
VDRDPWQFGFVVLEKMTGVAVGAAGFKGPPDDDGVVEIAYGIAPAPTYSRLVWRWERDPDERFR